MSIFQKIKNLDVYDYLVLATFGMIIFIVVFSAYQIYHKSSKVREQVALATTKKPETFTELYFENHLKLPSTIKIGEKYPFSFTIHNLEYKTMNYPYEVYIDTDGKRQNIEKKTVTLSHDNRVTINEEFSPISATRSAVVVNLLNKNQEIRFWIEGKESK